MPRSVSCGADCGLAACAVGGQREVEADRGGAQAEPRARRDDRGPADRHAQQHQPDIARRGERRRGDIEFGTHQDRGFAREHVADDPAEAGAHHPHQHGGHGRHAIAERLGRTEHRIGGEPDRIEPAQRLVAPPAFGRDPDHQRDDQAHAGGARVVHPEDRRIDQQVAHRAPADPGDQPEEDRGDDGLPALGRSERARGGEHREPGEIEPARSGGKDVGRQDRGGQHPPGLAAVARDTSEGEAATGFCAISRLTTNLSTGGDNSLWITGKSPRAARVRGAILPVLILLCTACG
ncbi:hypothetical protein SPHINGOT1_50008 [Sphingomonas sp. T1]|nr:hypothetical protein SPHINGOT1_50008 [Sphingomonas sp. T1]